MIVFEQTLKTFSIHWLQREDQTLTLQPFFSLLHIPYHTSNILIVLKDSVRLEIDVTFVSILFIYSYLLSAYRFLMINKNNFASFRIILDYPHL